MGAPREFDATPAASAAEAGVVILTLLRRCAVIFAPQSELMMVVDAGGNQCLRCVGRCF